MINTDVLPDIEELHKVSSLKAFILCVVSRVRSIVFATVPCIILQTTSPRQSLETRESSQETGKASHALGDLLGREWFSSWALKKRPKTCDLYFRYASFVL